MISDNSMNFLIKRVSFSTDSIGDKSFGEEFQVERFILEDSNFEILKQNIPQNNKLVPNSERYHINGNELVYSIEYI